jgi:hypothetical protein
VLVFVRLAGPAAFANRSIEKGFGALKKPSGGPKPLSGTNVDFAENVAETCPDSEDIRKLSFPRTLVPVANFSVKFVNPTSVMSVGTLNPTVFPPGRP